MQVLRERIELIKNLLEAYFELILFNTATFNKISLKNKTRIASDIL